MRRFFAFGPAFVVLMACGVVLLLGPSVVRRVNAAQTQALVNVAQRSLDGDDVLERLNAAVRNIAQATEPSVVHIDVLGSNRAPMGASGSGWVYDGLGHIVTNAHVVAGAREILAQFYDGHVVKAALVGADADSDIAVLRVEGGDERVAARRASGERVQIGDRVFAFGSPFGFKFSMSEGIVSGLGRSAVTPMGRARISNFIQTDAAVNPGNSGGPLVDVRGRVVGMNVAIATASTQGSSEGQSAGISFAIPLGTIESRVKQIIAGGRIVNGYIGILFIDSRGIVEKGKPQGVSVDDVVEGGPAERAGIRPGDVVVAIDDEPAVDGNVLSSIISSRSPGDTIRLRVWRDGQTLSLNSSVIERPADNMVRFTENRLFSRFGLALVESEGRVTVGRVKTQSPAEVAGFVTGQTIARISDRPTVTVDGALELLSRSNLFRGSRVEVTVLDPDSEVEKVLTIQESPR